MNKKTLKQKSPNKRKQKTPTQTKMEFIFCDQLLLDMGMWLRYPATPFNKTIFILSANINCK